ncbi:MAG TPA: hypothetical protein VMF14_11775 [Solirubrobacteraceae bacterium]|nr:hypothetical protein [Solirubrobacteraceae bacterium]
MTPSALTPAARGTAKKSRSDNPSRPSSGRGSGHRSNVRRSVAPTAPRRVSGPAGGAASGGVIAVPAPTRERPTRERPAPRRERTVPQRERTAPSRSRTSRSRRSARSAARGPWPLRAAGYVRSLPDHILLDRIIRGRVWIPLLGLLLAGIVAMQVEVLKLNAGIGRSLERGSALQGQNELLRASVSQLSDEQRIERIAAQMGMLMPAPDQLRFVSTGADQAQRAATNIHAADPTDFLAALPTIGAPTAPQGTSVNTDVGLTPSASATSSTASGDTTTATGATGSTDSTGSTDTTASTDSTAPTDTSAPSDTGASTGTATATGAGAAAGTTQTTPVTPAPTTGTSDQSAASGGVGATPTGG